MRITPSWWLLVALGASGCGDDAGGAGGGASEPVLGTTLDEGADQDAAQRFYDACEDEGGILADLCRGSGVFWSGTCYAPPPAPAADEFACDGLFNCPVGDVCATTTPMADGCYDHACEPVPAACADDPTCACLRERDPSIDGCTTDDAGNPTVNRPWGPG